MLSNETCSPAGFAMIHFLYDAVYIYLETHNMFTQEKNQRNSWASAIACIRTNNPCTLSRNKNLFDSTVYNTVMGK